MDDKALALNEIRSFNRYYTRLLGLIDNHILQSPFSLTEARVLYEINNLEGCTASKLMEKLGMDKGYVSRILKKFEAGGLITRSASESDNRLFYVRPTEKGVDAYNTISHASDLQIGGLVGRLSEDGLNKLLDAMRTIEGLLTSDMKLVTVRSFRREDAEYVIDRHNMLYESEYGFNPEFGKYVEDALYSFMDDDDRTGEELWIAELDGRPLGCIAIVRAGEGTAQLRWFLIEPEMRGKGLGRMLMEKALGFCRENHYRQVFLWTVNILEAARHLYGSYGFRLTETEEHDVWGQHLTEERWDLKLE